MSKIAVFGGNGFAGSAIAKEAASRGHEVTVVARSAQSGTDTNVVQGSVHDNTIVEQITADNDVVVVAIPAREIDGKRLLDAVTPLADAAARNGARIAVVGAPAACWSPRVGHASSTPPTSRTHTRVRHSLTPTSSMRSARPTAMSTGST